MSTNIKTLLQAAGIKHLRPTKKALHTMAISQRRYTQLVENINKNPITVNELESIKSFIKGFAAIDLNSLVGDSRKDDLNK